MNKVILELTLNGRKHTYFRRMDVYGKPVMTTNINSAKKIKENTTKDIIKLLIEQYGKDNIKDVNLIKDEAKQN